MQDRVVRFQVSDGSVSNTQQRVISILSFIRASQTLPYCESFETAGNGIRYQAYPFNEGNNDFWERHNASGGTPHPSHSAAFTGMNNDWVWASEDVESADNPNPANIGEIYFNPFDLSTNAADVKVSLLLGAVDANTFEGTDYFIMQYSLDGGAWTTYAAFYPNGSNKLQEDIDLNGSPDAAGIVLNFCSISSNRYYSNRRNRNNFANKSAT